MPTTAKSSPARSSRRHTPWILVLVGLLVICIESTSLMSAVDTGRWLLQICHSLYGQTDTPIFHQANFTFRKIGHFTGYGILGLLFAHGWNATLRRVSHAEAASRREMIAFLAILCVFVVAGLDEWHQAYLPERDSSFADVLLDGAGATLFNVLSLIYNTIRRNPA